MRRLHEYQRVAVQRAVEDATRRWIFNDEMGLGKTAEAIRCLEIVRPQRVLVVCPAIVRSNWLRELSIWWPEHPEAGAIFAGRSRGSLSKKKKAALAAAYEAPIQVVSYNLLKHVDQTGWDVIIFDECHRLKTPQTQWSKVARSIVLHNPQARVYGLTATLMPDKPLDACGIIECIWPGRMGGIHPHYGLQAKCKARYANEIRHEHGTDYIGVNKLYAAELAARLQAMSSRTTKLDVLHLIPTFHVSFKLLEQESRVKWTNDLDKDLETAGALKALYALDWARDAKESNSHVAVLTHLRSTAREIADRLMEEEHAAVYCITGAQTPEKRNELLAEAAGKPSAIVVATMDSVGIGIDLTFCTACLVAELSYRPDVVIQALGRFSRLSGKVPSSVEIIAIRETLDEIVADRICQKIEAINSVGSAGLSEDRLVSEIGSAEDFKEMVLAIARGSTEDDYDL